MSAFADLKDRVPWEQIIAQLGETLGRGNRTRCLVHRGDNPSSAVYGDNRCHCFVCGFHGDKVDFLRVVHGLSLREALSRLADMAGVSLCDNRSRTYDPVPVVVAPEAAHRRAITAAKKNLARWELRKVIELTDNLRGLRDEQATVEALLRMIHKPGHSFSDDEYEFVFEWYAGLAAQIPCIENNLDILLPLPEYEATRLQWFLEEEAAHV